MGKSLEDNVSKYKDLYSTAETGLRHAESLLQERDKVGSTLVRKVTRCPGAAAKGAGDRRHGVRAQRDARRDGEAAGSGDCGT